MKPEEEQKLCERLTSNDPTQTRVLIHGTCSSLPAIFKAMQSNTTVEELILESVNVEGIDKSMALAVVLEHHPKLRHFCARDMSLREFNVLSFAMSQSKSLSSVSFEKVNFPEDGADALFYLRSVESIRIRDCWTDSFDSPYCRACTRCEYHRSNLTTDFLDVVSHYKERLEHIKSLELDGLSSFQIELVCRALPYWPLLEHLGLDRCYFGNGCISDLFKALDRHPSVVRSLSLARNWLESEGAQVLEDFLASNETLTVLDLSSNAIGPQGAAAIARGLGKNDTLEVLKLGHRVECIDDEFDVHLTANRIGEEGSEAIAVMLETNESLEEFWLPDQYMGEEGLCAFASRLPSMRGLKKLDLGYVTEETFTEDVASEFIDGLEHSLEVLEYGHQRYDADDECIDYLLRLNRAGRKLVVGQPNVPLALWPHVLGRDSADADAIFFFLREKPELYLHTTATRRKSTRKHRGRKRRRIHLH